MALFKDKMWIWGHNAGSHDNCGIPKSGRMTPVEGAMYLGIPNMCRVVYAGKPEPPFEQDALATDCLGQVVWSVIGDSSSNRNNDGGTDVTEVGIIARTHRNIIGGIMDDSLNPARIAMYTPESLSSFKCRLCDTAGRDMQLWTVIYTTELNDIAVPYLVECDAASLWTWRPEDILNIDQNFNKLQELFKGKPVLGGCYLWDYSAGREMPEDMLLYQLNNYYKRLKSGCMEGVIFCSNNVVDVGLDSVKIVKEWISVHKDENLNGFS